jgi:hypothetical protein
MRIFHFTARSVAPVWVRTLSRIQGKKKTPSPYTFVRQCAKTALPKLTLAAQETEAPHESQKAWGRANCWAGGARIDLEKLRGSPCRPAPGQPFSGSALLREEDLQMGGCMKRTDTLGKKVTLLSLVMVGLVISVVFLLTLASCGGKSTIVQITNKITSLPAGQTYTFTANIEHNHQQGVTVSLTGPGTLVVTNDTGIYLAPPAPPTPNSVTVTVTAGGGSASDSDTFTITPAAGPVVSISPTQPAVSVSAGTPVMLNITVSEDDPSDVLSASVSSSSNCGNDCGSFSTFGGAPGSGLYSLAFYPPTSMPASTLQIINVSSSMSNSTMGTAFVTVNP